MLGGWPQTGGGGADLTPLCEPPLPFEGRGLGERRAIASSFQWLSTEWGDMLALGP